MASSDEAPVQGRVQELLAGLRSKKGLQLSPVALTEWKARLAQVPTAERRECAVHLLAAGSKFLRVAGPKVEPAVRQLVELAQGLLEAKPSRWASGTKR